MRPFLSDIDPGPACPDVVRMIVEIPKNGNPRYDQVQTMDEIFAHVRREIEHFFTIYKELEGRQTSTLGWGDRESDPRLPQQQSKKRAG